MSTQGKVLTIEELEPLPIESVVLLDKALDLLAEEERAFIRLHFLEGRTQAEIASMMNISPSAVKQRLYRATAKLRKALQNKSVSDKKPPTEGLSGWNSPQTASLAERHSILVDKKYSVGLSKEEVEELFRLKQQIDDENETFYQPVIQHLTEIGERLKAKSQQPTEK